jgi:glucokinase
MSDRLALGFDLGGTKIYSVVADQTGAVRGEDRRPTEAARGPEAVVSRIVGSLDAALSTAGLSKQQVRGAGISTPGPCDPDRGIVTDAPNLPGWRDIPLRQLIEEATGLPAVMENDANAAAYGEYRFGAGRGSRHLIYVTLGTGIGGGIIIDGVIYHGASGAAGEVGHLVVDPAGPPCNCGARGCLEALASGPAIERAAKAEMAAGRSPGLESIAGQGPVTAELVRQAALQGDAASRRVIEQAGRHLGVALAGLLNVFNPDILILGGGLIGVGDLYLQPAMATAREQAFDQVASDVTIVTAALGERAGALGAAALVLKDAPG